jgi:hypothetical protein
MWYILYHLVETGSKFEKESLLIGNIHPFNILLSEKGFVKIVSQHSLPVRQKALAFLAP